MINKIIFNNDKNIEKNSKIWNLIASVLNAGISAYMLMIVTRFIGKLDGGIFTIASTLAYQLLTIASYGMRNYQVTDTKEKFSFNDYLTSRYFTSLFMLIGMIIIIIYNGYDFDKSIVVIAFIMFKWVDALEDVYHGYYQQHNRLDVACREQSYRYIFSLLVFTIASIMFKNLFVSCVITFILSLFFFIVVNYFIKKEFNIKKTKVNKKNVLKLLFDCFPLFLSAYLYLYICNSPKYAIDKVATTMDQTYFGILFMPVFVINLISTLIYRPLLTKLAEKWNNKRKRDFLKEITKQLIIIAVLTAIAIVFAYYLGTEILTFIYKVNMFEYKKELVLLMVGGGFNAFVGYMLCIITIVRAQKTVIYGYASVFFISLLLSNMMVKRMGIFGASILYDLLTITLGLYFVIVFLIIYFKRIKDNKKE